MLLMLLMLLLLTRSHELDHDHIIGRDPTTSHGCSIGNWCAIEQYLQLFCGGASLMISRAINQASE